MATSEEKDKTLEELKEKLALLKIELTSREIFEEKFKDYEMNWEKLVEKDNFETV
jgi:hypothetical protein